MSSSTSKSNRTGSMTLTVYSDSTAKDLVSVEMVSQTYRSTTFDGADFLKRLQAEAKRYDKSRAWNRARGDPVLFVQLVKYTVLSSAKTVLSAMGEDPERWSVHCRVLEEAIPLGSPVTVGSSVPTQADRSTKTDASGAADAKGTKEEDPEARRRRVAREHVEQTYEAEFYTTYAPE